MQNKLPQRNAGSESKSCRSMWKSTPKIWLACLLIGLAVLPGTWTETTAAESQTAAPAPARKKVTGTVKASGDGTPIIGAVVHQKDVASNAVVTDKRGNFQISVPTGAVLEISCLGYISREVTVGERMDYTIQMETDVKQVDEVVVVGYGTQKKSDLTGSVGVTKMSDLNKAPVVSFDQALAGRIAGVQVTSADDQPGGGMDIVIRGGNSLTQSNSPLYVVDGFPMTDFNAASLNPQDIKSISILKDASATAIYGSRGANGVVMIETQSGKPGRTTVSYDGYVGVASTSNRMDLMNPYEFVAYQLETNPTYANSVYLKDGKTLEDYKGQKSIDWQELLFRDALIHSHSLSVNGGNDKTTFSVSGSYANHEGVVDYSGYKRYRGRVYVNHKFNDRIRFNAAADYSRDESTGDIASQSTNTTQQYASYLMYRTWGARPVMGVGQDDITGSLFDPDAQDTRFNPVLDVKNSKRKKTGEYFRGNLNVSFKLHKNLELMIKGGVYNRTWRETGFYNSETSKGSSEMASNTKGVNGTVDFREARSWLNENTLTYRKKFRNAHNLTVLLGWTLQGNNEDKWGFAGEQVPNEQLGISGIDEGIPGKNTAYQSGNRMMSYLGRIDYNYKNRYLFTATFRADGSSKFSKDNRWGYFPSAAFAWRLSEEKFMKSVDFINNAKIRVSYGQTGNDRIGDFSRYPQMNMAYGYYYSFNNKTPLPGIGNSSIGNLDLKWETTDQTNVGLDLELFSGRIALTVDWYNKKTRDLLLNASIPYTSGYSKIYKNVGSIRNRGWEFSLSTVNIAARNFRWTSDFNISFNKNRILSLNDDETRLLTAVTQGWEMSKVNLYMAEVGSSAAQFIGLIWDGGYNYDDFNLVGDKYVLKSDRAANGSARDMIQPGDIKYRDVDGDGTITDKDVVVIGRALPIHIGGFNNNFTWGRFNLNVFFQWSYGNDVMNANRIYLEGNQTNRPALNQFKSYADRWTPENSDSKMFRAGGQGPVGFYSSRTLEDGSFLRLKTLQLSYNLSARACRYIGVQNLSVYVSGQNLFTWTDYSGMDPEVSVRNSALTPGFDYSAYPRSRTYVFGVKVTF